MRRNLLSSEGVMEELFRDVEGEKYGIFQEIMKMKEKFRKIRKNLEKLKKIQENSGKIREFKEKFRKIIKTGRFGKI